MGPGAREAHVEMEGSGALFLAGKLGGIGAELGGGSGVDAGGAGGGELGHHEVPRGGPGGADCRDEELGREGFAP